MSRLERGEIRSVKKQRQKVDDLRSNGKATWGLDTPLSSMTQEKWDEDITKRKGLKLSTLKSHLQNFQALIRHHGLSLGAPLIPNFEHVVVPKDKQSRRKETITS